MLITHEQCNKLIFDVLGAHTTEDFHSSFPPRRITPVAMHCPDKTQSWNANVSQDLLCRLGNELILIDNQLSYLQDCSSTNTRQCNLGSPSSLIYKKRLYETIQYSCLLLRLTSQTYKSFGDTIDQMCIL